MGRRDRFELRLCILVLAVGYILVTVHGDFEQSLAHCCNLGVKWGVENLQCTSFPAPVVSIPNEQQAVCLSAVHICCLKKHRERQCDLGKQSARADKECSVTRDLGGESHKDCCEGCKLGLVAGSMSVGCSFRTFQLGSPWDDAFSSCCQLTNPQISSPANSRSPSLPIGISTPRPPIIPEGPPNSIEEESEDLCARFPGELCAHICVPTSGGSSSYRCECRDGFQLLADGKSCQQATQYDRCSIENPCSQKCTDTGLAVECSCNSGFQLATDEKTCLDVDECAIGADNCDLLLEICVNQPGSFSCMPRPNGPPGAQGPATANPPAGDNRCPRGFKYNTESRVCDDLDECLSSSTCPADTLCQNTIGSFDCVRRPQVDDCPRGFRYSSILQNCIDIDECREQTEICPKTKPVCINLQGSYKCVVRNESTLLLGPSVTCPAGYKFNTAQQSCEDVDECLEQLDSCQSGTEMCINELGRYRCEQFSADASSTVGRRIGDYLEDDDFNIDATICPPGYIYDDDEQVCIDLDECLNAVLEERNVCDPDAQRCVNTEGSFECVEKCQPGYEPDAIEPMGPCVDIDECGSSTVNGSRQGVNHTCTLAEKCVNTPGSYECVQLRPVLQTFSYTTSTTAAPPTRPTRPSTTSTVATTSTTTSTTTQTPVTTTRISTTSRSAGVARPTTSSGCQLGYRKEGNRCKDINECLDGTHTCDLTQTDCVNTAGSFRCKPLAPCRPGFRRAPSTGRCEDIDECVEGSHNCPTLTTLCVNNYGSFDCRPYPVCPSGHRFSVEARFCQDVDECAEGTHNCTGGAGSCVNAVGSFRCVDSEPSSGSGSGPGEGSCDLGYRFDLATLQCKDIDECREARSQCRPMKERCINLIGSYRCEPLASSTTTTTTTSTTTTAKPTTLSTTKATTTATTVKPATTTTSAGSSGGGCPSGYRLSRRNRTCQDIDECSEGQYYCNVETEMCVNERGGYRCVTRPDALPPASATTPNPTAPPRIPCPRGYIFSEDSRRCVDVNECMASTGSPCRGNQQCENTVGSYVCRCAVGYRFNANTQLCEDINECLLDFHDCLSTQRCDNTIGSYTCFRLTNCGTGYTFNSQTSSCEDDDECESGAHDCHILGPLFQCRNTEGSFRCERKRCNDRTDGLTHLDEDSGRCVKPPQCSEGFEPGPRGKCNDIDECARGAPCPRGHQCTNTIGSYTCVSTLRCEAGFEANTAGTQCQDIDECAKSTHDCKRNQICQNRPGGYACICQQGFTVGANRECEDVDECTRYAGQVCSPNSQCVNTVGSYRCECKEGFRSGSDPRSCVDIDECAETARLCQQTCTNSWGSYQCSCQAGYQLAADGRSCQDVDECELYKERGGLCIGLCVNEPGSYSCKCPDGYRLAADNRTCQDIDECARPGVCRSEETCLNTRGGYYCNAISCPPNYVRDTEHRNYHDRQDSVACKKQCQPRDTLCLFNTTQSITFQHIAIPTVKRVPSPMVLSRMQAVSISGGWTYSISFDIIEGNKFGIFGVSQQQNTGVLELVRPAVGPVRYSIQMQMSVVGVFANRQQTTRHLAIIDISVSAYEF